MKIKIVSASITLSGSAYNMRTKGAIQKKLTDEKFKFTTLGNGDSFTGFIIDQDLSNQQISDLRSYFNNLANPEDISIMAETEII